MEKHRISGDLLILAGLALILGAVNGCAIRKASPLQDYRLTETGGAGFLLPPATYSASDNGLESNISLFDLPMRPNSTVRACSIHDSWFSLYESGSSAKMRWIAEVPSPTAWYNEDFLLHARSYWDQFVDDLYSLEVAGCLSPTSYETTVNQIGESIPAPLFDSFFFKYSLDDRGFVTLRPGMRLVIDRAFFSAAHGDKESNADFLGEGTWYYDIVGKLRGITLRRRRVGFTRGVPSTVRKTDVTAFSAFQHKRALRLFLLTLLVPPDEKRNALLLGSDDPSEMVQASHKIERDPSVQCNQLVSENVACTEFDGPVSVSVEVNVSVNQRRAYFPIGATLQDALSSVPPDKLAHVLRTLRIQRLFRDKYFSVEFNSNDRHVFQLVLFAGDKVSWAYE